MSVVLFADWTHYALGIPLFLVSVFLILLVLVQRGRGGGLAGALGGMGGQSAFGAKAGDQFTKITIVAAICWILLCMLSIKVLSPPIVEDDGSGEPSVTARGDGAATDGEEADAKDSDDKAADDKSADEKSADEKSGNEKSTDEASTEAKAADVNSTAPEATGEGDETANGATESNPASDAVENAADESTTNPGN